MKPLGIQLGIGPNGPTLGCRMPTSVEDKVWDAVQEAIEAGWTVEQFRRECAEAWKGLLRDRMNDDMERWQR